MEKIKRDTKEKIRIFKSCFTGLQNVYGTYDTKTGKVRQVKESVTDKVIKDHLTGRQSYGVYLLAGDKIKSLAVDFDNDDIHQPAIFLNMAKRLGITAYVERSKSKGYHVWVFFDSPVSSHKARIVAKKILFSMGKPETEMFPKQDSLSSNVSYGNFINAPLFGKLVPKNRTVFSDPDNLTVPHPDQWQLLENVERVTESKLDVIIESCGLNEQQSAVEKPKYNNQTSGNDGTSYYGLPPCGRRMLTEGVSSFQRISCFRLAIHLKRSGLPFDLAAAVLNMWSKKNRPTDGKQIITDVEIQEQTKCAYKRHYRSLGCDEPAIAAYCDKNCPLHAYKNSKHPA